MTTPFAAKLRLTAAALGCATRKELCERFRAVNPATAFDVERCHKWLQGVAMPRSATVYDDWVKVIGFDRSAAWVAASTQDAFAEALCVHLSADRAELEARAERFGGARAAGPAPRDARLGAFVSYAWAMSPRHEGKLIRGLLTFGPTRGRRFAACYEEGLTTGLLRLTGSGRESGRTLHLDLAMEGDAAAAPFYMVLLTPGRPLDALCGEFVGVPTNAAAPEPTVSRLVALRIDPALAAVALAPDCYLSADAAALAADLGPLDFGCRAAQLAAVVLELLARARPSLGRTCAADLSVLTAALEIDFRAPEPALSAPVP